MLEEHICKNCADYDEYRDYCANEDSLFYTNYGSADNNKLPKDGCSAFVTQHPTIKQVLQNMKAQLMETEQDNEDSFIAAHGGKRKAANLKVIIDVLDKQLKREE